MSKRSRSRSRSNSAATIAARQQAEHDAQYGEPLYSLTYEMNELELARAANLYGPASLKSVFLGVTVGALVLLMLSIILYPDNYTLMTILIIISLMATGITSEWGRIATHFARKTTLGARGTDNRRHVVVTKDKVVEEGPDEAVGTYPLAELARVRSTTDSTLVDFGDKRCVFIPRSAMSEGRYQSLVRFFSERAAGTDKG